MTESKNVGMMNELILKKDFENKEEWEKFYYVSGEERLQKIKSFIEQKKKKSKSRSAS